MQLTPNFSLAELIRSETAERDGINNTPHDDIIPNLQHLAKGLEAVQALLGSPLDISSGYRSVELNRAVGGSGASQHIDGLAADFTCPGFGSPLDVAAAIQASDLVFDQCILEFGRWVHLSVSAEPRQRVLTIYNSKDGYLDGLWAPDGRQVA
jgi:hypothetical protein